jgi:homoserine dehydrogenase
MMRQIGIGIAGLGTVGAGVYKHLAQNRALLMERLGVELVVRRAAVRDLLRPRVVNVPPEQLTTRWQDIVADPAVDIVVELMGGIDEPLALMRAAIAAGKAVVTGNKALLAEHGQEIFALAAEKKVPVFFEASTAGGIPIIKTIREALIANHIVSIHGIINGTSNYILTRMTDAGLDFADALAEAQAQGYAEADPTLDINGWDAAHKAIILASLSYGFWVGTDQIFVEGIEKLTATDIRFADELGYRVKLLAIIKAGDNPSAGHSGGIEVRVHPTLIPKTHVLASVSGVFNAVAVRGDVVGETLFYGRGAGQDPTSSAVISDLAEAAATLGGQHRSYGFTPHGLYGVCQPLEGIVSRYYLRLAVDDKPGVLAQVAGILGKNEIGISSVVQPEKHDAADHAQLMLMLDHASHRQMQAALGEILTLPCVVPPAALLRVETLGA